MICPVLVANEMSGLKGRVGVRSHPHWRLKVDAVISGPSFGTGNEDQGSHYASDEWTVHLDPRRLSIKLCLRSCQASRSKRVSKMALSWSRASWTRPLTLYQRPFSNEVIVKPSFIFRVSSDWK